RKVSRSAANFGSFDAALPSGSRYCRYSISNFADIVKSRTPSGNMTYGPRSLPNHRGGAMSERDLEQGIALDLSGTMTYGGYLRLDRILSAQTPLSDPPHHD